MLTILFWRLWYIGSYTILAKPIKSLELQMIEFSMIIIIIINVFTGIMKKKNKQKKNKNKTKQKGISLKNLLPRV